MKIITKLMIVVGIIFIMIVGLFVNLLPKYVEKSRNQVQTGQVTRITNETKNLHQSLFIADLHADSLLWDRNLAKKSNYGHVDIPRLIEGNIALQVFSVVTKTPKNLNLYKNTDDSDNITLLAIAQLWPLKTWTSEFERANFQAQKLQKLEKQSPNTFYLIKTKQDFQHYLHQRKTNSKITAGLLSLEGAHALEGKIENLDKLYASGFRIIGFTHFFDNELGGSAHGVLKGGITEFGKRVTQRMDELEMFIDISHASPALIEDIFALSRRPIIASHTGIQAVCKSASFRNLTDEQIQKVAASGGIVGIGFWPTATCGEGIAGVVKAIRYVVELVGIEYVALGSDFDGNVMVPFTALNISQITHALINAGFNEAQINNIMGQNVARLFNNYLPNH